MSLVHDVRGIRSGWEGLIRLLRGRSFKLEDVAWRYQGLGNIIKALSQKVLR